jgi:hypothetical protein
LNAIPAREKVLFAFFWSLCPEVIDRLICVRKESWRYQEFFEMMRSNHIENNREVVPSGASETEQTQVAPVIVI